MTDRFFKALKKGKRDQVFNPWFETDTENDRDRTGPEKRRSNLRAYLDERKNARYLLLAEALGYQGGHFTGIPMTSERIILGHKEEEGIFPAHVCRSPLTRTSNTDRYDNGFNEPTATIVWKKLIQEGLDTRDFIFWNAFPWHPYKEAKGLLSNRTPGTSEMKAGEPVLKALLDTFCFKQIIALGNKAEMSLNRMGIEAIKVRHPAMGGADKFRGQILKAISS